MPTPNDTTTPDVQEAAARYQARGWHLVRLHPQSKAAIEGDWPNKRPEPDAFLPGEQVGILTGEPSGGLADVDIDDKASATIVREMLPPTEAVFGRASKPDSHVLYRAMGSLPASVKYTDPDKSLLGELRLTGLQTMAPPSLHPSGERVEWSRSGEPREIAANALAESVGWAFTAALLVRHWPEWKDNHHDIALHLAGALLKAGKDYERVEHLIKIICTYGDDDPKEIIDDRLRAVADTAAKIAAGDSENVGGLSSLTDIVGRTIARKIREWCRLKVETEPHAECTDYGNGRRLVERHGADLLYVRKGAGWYVWDGARYAPDAIGRADQLAKDTALTIFDEQKRVATTDQSRARALGKHAQRSLNITGIHGTLEATQTEPEIVATVADLDADPYLLNVLNGTIDLRTGGLSPHRREDMHTKVCPVTYDPQATCPLWTKFLLRAMGGDADKAAYLQRVIGYSLTGDTREQAVFLLHGSGGNGKSTLVETLLWLLGDYALKIPTETLMAKRGDSIPNDIAQLPGARFVAANETSQGQRLNEAVVKDLSGGDTISARFMRREWFRFKPTHKTFVYGNHRPVITGTDEGIWRRIRLIDFGPRVTDDERQKDFERVLKGEAPGILAWAIEGCMQWLGRGGLAEPRSVLDATAEYRAEMDVIAGFIETCCETHAKHKEKGADLYAAYSGWCADNGEDPLSSTTFGNELHRHDFPKWKANGAIWRQGIKLTKAGREFTRFRVVMDDEQANPFAGPRGA